jgi:uncharacterized membrane protein YeiH
MSDMAFQIPLWAELSAVGLGALQGAMFAGRLRDRHLDWLGVVLIGIGVALGGAVLRDLLLNEVPASMQSNVHLAVAISAALVGMALQRLFSRLTPLIDALDAVSIGLFGAIGTSKALAAGLPAIPSVVVGVLAAVGGSVLRDVALNLPTALMCVGSLYAVAAGAGTVLLVVLVELGTSVSAAATAAVVTTAVIRLGAMRFGWTVAEQRPLELRRAWRRK